MKTSSPPARHPIAPRRTALLLIDVINDLRFPAGRRLLRYALPAAKRLASLRRRAKAASIPVIYVNDNFGRWQSDFRAQVAHCSRSGSLGREITLLLSPDADDFFVLKPRHSGFYSTTLDLLLHHLGIDTVILTGFAGNICLLYTANDAYMRDYRIIVPPDCTASESLSAHRYALHHIKTCLKARLTPSSSLRFK